MSSHYQSTTRDLPESLHMSSPATATGSRSPSPLTPESSDSLDPVLHNDLELSSWCHSLSPAKSLSPQSCWDPTLCFDAGKPEDDEMLRLDDLIEQHAYDEYSSIHFNLHHFTYRANQSSFWLELFIFFTSVYDYKCHTACHITHRTELSTIEPVNTLSVQSSLSHQAHSASCISTPQTRPFFDKPESRPSSEGVMLQVRSHS
jgi:hypothetical protein